MDFDPKDIGLFPSDWFSTSTEYVGRGRAEFHDPQGAVEGPVIARFDEFGESSIEMDVEEFKPNGTWSFGLWAFLIGGTPAPDGESRKVFFGAKSNPCTSLTVTTSQGVFSAVDEIHCSYRMRSGPTGQEEAELTFDLLRSQFDCSLAGKAKYWVLPLSNFTSNFTERHLDLDRHPLRIYPTPPIPDCLSDREAVYARLRANSRNRLIVFEFNRALGFIEPLPDFDVRKKRLLSGRERNTITAVMVGELGSSGIDYADLDQWFPFDFLPLLALATGVEVGAPWIEFREAEGGLVRRIHVKVGQPLFSRGHPAIDEGVRRGTGRLLSQAQTSTDFGKSYLRVAVKHGVRAGLYSLTLEDRLSHVFRALDCLCQEYQLQKDLTPKQILSDKSTVADLNKAIRSCSKAILEMAKGVENEGEVAEAKVLRQVAQQVSWAKNIRTGFGKAVVELMKRFGLPDAGIVDTYFRMKPRSDGRDWARVLSYYRGKTMHRGYFEFRELEHDVEAVLTVLNRLHDILVRILLKLPDYDGTYQPTVLTMTARETADWVSSDTPESVLGYR